MKKAFAMISIVSALTMSVVPAFAANNNGGSITINGGKGNTNNIKQTNNITINLTDIGGHWAEKAIKDLVKKGVLSGDDKHKFNPNGNV
ncbi:MAG: S-layer homology domain-containing protein, partial [Tumebacillaceae bacterium]